MLLLRALGSLCTPGRHVPERRGSKGGPVKMPFLQLPFSPHLLLLHAFPSWGLSLLRTRPLGGRDIPGVSDGCHPLVTIPGVLCPQLQGFLVLVAEVNREIMLHQEEDSSNYQGDRHGTGSVSC